MIKFGSLNYYQHITTFFYSSESRLLWYLYRKSFAKTSKNF